VLGQKLSAVVFKQNGQRPCFKSVYNSIKYEIAHKYFKQLPSTLKLTFSTTAVNNRWQLAMGECSAYSSLQADLKVKFAAWPASWRPQLALTDFGPEEPEWTLAYD